MDAPKDGNEQGSIALGAAPSKEQLALAKRSDAWGIEDLGISWLIVDYLVDLMVV